MLESLFQDVRYGARLLAKKPGFTAVAVLTLALGIGANTAIFSILDPLLLRKLPVRAPDELVVLDAVGAIHKRDAWPILALDRFRDLRAFAGALAFVPIDFDRQSGDGRTSTVRAELVSGDYFSLLGVHPYAGRLLEPDDDRGAFGSQVAVLSFNYWQREYHGDRAIIGKMVPVHNMTYVVAGVAPPEFSGMVVGEAPDFYLPLKAGRPLQSSTPYDPGEWVTIVARLRPGVSPQQAQVAMEPLLPRIAEDAGVPEVERKQAMAHAVITPAARGLSHLRERFSLPARILMGVVGLVLLIACCNVANLLLAQGTERRREIMVRTALGAARWRTVRQLVTESMLLAAAGALAGLVVGRVASGMLVASLATERSHATLAAGLSGRVFLFALTITVFTVLICGLVPALSASRLNLGHDLKASGAGGRRFAHTRLASALVLGQVALSVTLLGAAGLLLHSLVNLETFDAGFNRDRVVVLEMNGNAPGETAEQVKAFYDRLVRRAQELPGVQSASLSTFTPISGHVLGINLNVDGYVPQPGEQTHAFFTAVRPKYFATLGIPLLRGRDFSVHDTPDSPPVAIINQTMARHFFGDPTVPENSPLGKRFKFVEGSRPPMEIVGVVGDSKYNDLREATPDFFYLASLQSQPRSTIRATLSVRAAGSARAAENSSAAGNAGAARNVGTAGSSSPYGKARDAGATAEMLVRPLRDLVRQLDPTVNVASVRTLRQQVDESLRQDRLIATLCGTFSLLALGLTCVGLFGLLSFSVARRTNEIGIRMALGARRLDIMRLVVGHGMRLVCVGLALGVFGALAATALIKNLLFGVGRADPATFLGICALLAIAALIACYVPARRATYVDPLVALRNE
ncbi:MAG: ABC transporter permease [Acidobacteriia bacterium]|nr:ABC transporter permease [Terriglobia bacterium]